MTPFLTGFLVGAAVIAAIWIVASLSRNRCPECDAKPKCVTGQEAIHSERRMIGFLTVYRCWAGHTWRKASISPG